MELQVFFRSDKDLAMWWSKINISQLWHVYYYCLRVDIVKVISACRASPYISTAFTLTLSWVPRILSHELCDNTETMHSPGPWSHFCSSVWFISHLSDGSVGGITFCTTVPFSFYVQSRSSTARDSCLSAETALEQSSCSYLSTETRL